MRTVGYPWPRQRGSWFVNMHNLRPPSVQRSPAFSASREQAEIERTRPDDVLILEGGASDQVISLGGLPTELQSVERHSIETS